MYITKIGNENEELPSSTNSNLQVQTKGRLFSSIAERGFHVQLAPSSLNVTTIQADLLTHAGKVRGIKTDPILKNLKMKR